MARGPKELKQRAAAVNIPAIYVNDNFGRWRSDFKHLVDHCLLSESRGQEVVRLLQPDENDYFVLKPKHSGFSSTSLDLLLKYLEAKSLILTGLGSDICVLFTANDAYMRDYDLYVPEDCVAANTAEANEYALRQILNILKADVTPSRRMRVEAINKSKH